MRFKNGRKFISVILFAAVFMTFTASKAVYAQTCTDIADIPLEVSQISGAPGMIMFIIDNSGSMDWEIMTENLAGQGTLADDASAGFDLQQVASYEEMGYEYIFETDTTGGVDMILEDDGSTRDRFLWQARWHGYNKLYYNPSIAYHPWPRWDELANESQDVLKHPNSVQPDPPDTTTNGRQAHLDNPRIQPMDNKYTYDLTATFATLSTGGSVTIDNCGSEGTFELTAGPDNGWVLQDISDAYGDCNGNGTDDGYLTDATGQYEATWTVDLPAGTYDLEAIWDAYEERSTAVTFEIYDGNALIETVTADQTDTANEGTFRPLAQDLSISSGTAVVKLVHEVTSVNAGSTSDEAFADAIRFVQSAETISIKQRHYYVRNANGTFLVNLTDADGDGYPDYYKYNDDGDNFLEDGELLNLTQSEAVSYGVATGRTLAEEKQNFANWFSFYRKRDYTARYALAQVITQMSNVLFGFSTIPEREDLGVRWLDVDFDGQHFDDSPELLNRVYMLSDPSSGTTLRKGMNKVGKYFQELGGTFANTADKNALGIYSDGGETYPYFTADHGGECQQTFTIMMTDGAYNGQGPNIPNADGDNNTEFDGGKYADAYEDTLADGAMQFYETDLKTNLGNNVPTNYADDNRQQHMVTYALSYGVYGTKDPANWPDCQSLECTEDSCCPDWPEPTAGSLTTLDDLYHASVNGRGLYLNAANPPELLDALMRIKADIEFRLGSAAAVTTNAVQRQVGAQVYQGIYHSGNWWGDLLAKPVDPDTGTIGEAEWSAKTQLDSVSWDARTIFTLNDSTGSGIPFQYASLSSDQESALQNGLTSVFGSGTGMTSVEELVEYLRGNAGYEVKNGGPARSREGKLGDIVHSEPFYKNGAVYIGANDGMLHAFDASNGQELFSYVPSMVYNNLAKLADPEYAHKYFVDATPYARDVSGSQTLLAGGLAQGGKGVYCLDITGAENASEIPSTGEVGPTDVVLWEYDGLNDDGTVGDDDLGYVHGRAYIANTEAGWVVIFGNGYNSNSGEAVLYVLDAFDGSVVRKFETGAASCNGMSSPALIDTEFDGTVDLIYAGDLNGNMWKFDIADSDPANWEIAYNDGTDPQPLYTARNQSGEIQPITSEPEVMMHCEADRDGYLVIFGTGQYLNQADLTDTSTQSIYGVWDWQKQLVADSVSNTEQKYLGALSTGTPRTLTHLEGDTSIFSSGQRPTLLEQTVVYEDTDWRILSDNAIYYYPDTDPSLTSSATHLGWYFDLPDTGERIFEDPMIQSGSVVFVSTSPQADDPCSAGGSSLVYQVDACSGGRTGESRFDVNDDGVIDESDKIDGKAVSGMKIDATIYAPLGLSDKLYLNDATGKIWEVQTTEDPEGISYWRIIK